MNTILIGAHYQHYKGGEYEIVGFAHHSETQETLVLYKPLYACPDLEPRYPAGVVFARPYDLFVDSVEIDMVKRPRFIRLDT